MKKIVFALFGIALLASCGQPSSVKPTKSVTLDVQVSNSKTSAGGSGIAGRVVSTPTGSLDISSFMLSIANVHIEENAGFEGEQSGGNDTNDGSDSAAESPETSDIVLNGPFTVDAVNGTVSLQKVDVFPGAFKNVNFSLFVQSGTPFSDNSIVVKGTFKNGTVSTPFVIQSKLSSTIQLPLQGAGLTVKDKGTATVTIIVDVASLLSNIDLGTATVTNGEIRLDATSNTSLLTAFETNLIKFTEATEKD